MQCRRQTKNWKLRERKTERNLQSVNLTLDLFLCEQNGIYLTQKGETRWLEMCFEGGNRVPVILAEIRGILMNSGRACFYCFSAGKRLSGGGRRSRSKYRRMWDRTEEHGRAGAGKAKEGSWTQSRASKLNSVAGWPKSLFLAQYCGILAQVSLFGSWLWRVSPSVTFGGLWSWVAK